MQPTRLSGRGGRVVAALPFSWKLFLLSLLAIALAPLEYVWRQYMVCWANHTGSEGTIKVGSTAIAELRSWELTESMEPIEDTVLSDTSRTYVSGLKGWTGSATAFWDETDTTGQEALDIGASVSLVFLPEGATTGDKKFTGTALVTNVARSAAIQGMVEVTFQFQGTGALATGLVS